MTTLIATVNVIVIGMLKLPVSQALGDRCSSVRFSAMHHLPAVIMSVLNRQGAGRGLSRAVIQAGAA